MASANNSIPAHSITGLAGLQAGVLGVFAMLAWLGVSARWQRSSFWAAANLMASTFYGDAAIHYGFARSTLSGLALYVLLYGTVGAIFGLVVHQQARGLRLLLLGIVFALAWYYVSFGFLWKRLSPLLALLHTEQPTIVGHLIYGAILGRFDQFLPRARE